MEEDLSVLNEPEAKLQGLKDTFEQVQIKLGDWMKTIDCQLEKDGTAQLENVARQQQRIEELEMQIRKLQAAEKDKNAAAAELGAEVRRLEGDVKAVQLESDALLLRRENLSERVTQLTDTNTHARQVLETREAVTQQTQRELEKSLEFFRDRLGLQLKKVSGGRIQMVMTCIDYKDPSHPYYCFVRITPQRKYEVSECVPEVEGFQNLVAQLNTSNDFKGFVLALRKAFQATV